MMGCLLAPVRVGDMVALEAIHFMAILVAVRVDMIAIGIVVCLIIIYWYNR